MGALDLLFATKPESERLHQAALMVLLEKTPLLEKLTGIGLRSPKVEWEPEQGAFDLRVADADGRHVLIELKVDSVLSMRQIREQLAHDSVRSGGVPMYWLVGTTAISRGVRWGQWKEILGEKSRPAIFDGDALTTAIRASVTADTAGEVRELAEGYGRLLDGLSLRTRLYAGRRVEEFGYHDWLGFFDELRQAVDFRVGSTVAYVTNAAGGFVCCAWEGIPTPLGGLYLQFEEQTLCLKLWVDEMAKEKRSPARRTAVEAALAVATKFPNLGVERTKGRPGESMTVARLGKVGLASNPRDERLLTSLSEAHEFVKATSAVLQGATLGT